MVKKVILLILSVPFLLISCDIGRLHLSKQEQEKVILKHLPVNIIKFLHEKIYNSFKSEYEDDVKITLLRNSPVFKRLDNDILPFFYLWVSKYKAEKISHESIMTIAIKNKTEIVAYEIMGKEFLKDASLSIYFNFPFDVCHKIMKILKNE